VIARLLRVLPESFSAMTAFSLMVRRREAPPQDEGKGLESFSHFPVRLSG
jgi:hypothetical protein